MLPSQFQTRGSQKFAVGDALFSRKPLVALTVLGHAVHPYFDRIAQNADHARGRAGGGRRADFTVYAIAAGSSQLPMTRPPWDVDGLVCHVIGAAVNEIGCPSCGVERSVIVCFKVLVFDPKTTVPPITAAIAPIRTVGSNPTAPMTVAKIKIPPAAMVTFEMRMIFRHLSIMSVRSSMRASMCKICSRRSPSSSI